MKRMNVICILCRCRLDEGLVCICPAPVTRKSSSPVSIDVNNETASSSALISRGNDRLVVTNGFANMGFPSETLPQRRTYRR